MVDHPMRSASPEDRARPIPQLVSSARMLQDSRTIEWEDEFDVVVAVGTSHRWSKGEAAGQAEHLMQRRPANHARIREEYAYI